MTSEKNEGRVVMLVNSCDAYSDVWPLFFGALEEHWPDRNVDVVLNTESLSSGVKAERLIFSNYVGECGRDQWGARLLRALKSQESEYVMVVYDDFILESRFDSERLARLVEFMDEHPDAAVCYLAQMGFKTEQSAKQLGISKLLDRTEYRLNSAPALWRRTDLINYTGVHDTPWAWEVFGSYRTYGDGRGFYCPSRPEDDVYCYNHEKGGAIYRGKWVAEVVVSKNERYQLGIDLQQRGLVTKSSVQKRTLKWKVQFLWLGYKMVGFKFLYFVSRALGSKFR